MESMLTAKVCRSVCGVTLTSMPKRWQRVQARRKAASQLLDGTGRPPSVSQSKACCALPGAPKKVRSSPLDRLRLEYVAYLRDQRGLTEATIYHCVCFLNRFMAFRFDDTPGNLNDITPHNIVDFLRKLRSDGNAPRDKTPPSHLRNLFRFLFWSGKTKRDLAASIPRVAQPPRSRLPRYLKPEEVETLLDAVWSADPIGRRNYAMLMVLARLGLRAPEAIAIQLDDIDWRAGTILIRGKGKRHDRMPLPQDVGNAIVDYIRKGRRGTSRTLFVSNKVPYRPFADFTDPQLGTQGGIRAHRPQTAAEIRRLASAAAQPCDGHAA